MHVPHPNTQAVMIHGTLMDFARLSSRGALASVHEMTNVYTQI